MAYQNNQRAPMPAVVKQTISSAAARFENSILEFDKEQIYAIDALSKNSYSLKIAQQNPASLKMALFNLAAVGLSLNPVTKFAYLIPRRIGNEQRIILDISYQGFIEIAINAGAIKSCSVTLVREGDLSSGFQWIDNYTPPKNPPNPFIKDKGSIVGGYCQARMPDNSFLLFPMTIEEVYKRRDSSEMVKKNGVSGPWLDWEEEMIKKTIVRSAAKWWPNNGSTNLAEAQRTLNEDAGEGLSEEDRNIVHDVPVQLPPPPAANDLPQQIVDYVAKAVNRAEQVSAWSAAEEHFTSKYSDLNLRSYALSELKARKDAMKQSA